MLKKVEKKEVNLKNGGWKDQKIMKLKDLMHIYICIIFQKTIKMNKKINLLT